MSQDEAHEDQEGWTVLRLLNWTADFFEDRGIENPRLNAELLLGKVLGLERIMLYAEFERDITPEERQQYRELVKKRASRMPLQYLLGEARFYDRTFEVDSSVMVPRDDTEVLVDMCLKRIDGDGEGQRCADICCGSGVVGITLAAEREGLQVSAVDSQEGALSVARGNAQKHDVSDRITFHEGSLTEPLEDETFELLASNPPYIPSGEIDELQPEVSDHEPRVALDGGPDGLDIIRQLVPGAGRVLKPGGWMVLEMGEDQAEAVQEMVREQDVFKENGMEVATDTGGHRRVIAARKRGAERRG
ncbi:MAG: peptide chain release factor N(5)-glutamine methyltransferase [Planctomycetota bacterium]